MSHFMMLGRLLLLCAFTQALNFRPPCAPLDVASPYQSTWSCTDNLTDGSPVHWTGDTLDWVGLIRVDNALYRWLGQPIQDVAAAQQLSIDVLPTLTRYVFQAGSATLTVEFLTPAVDHDKEFVWATCPVTTVSFLIEGSASAEVYFDMSAATATQKSDQEVTWAREPGPGIEVMRTGTVAQKVCGQTSDRCVGFRYVAVASGAKTVMASASQTRAAFAQGSYSKMEDDAGPARKASDRPLVLSAALAVTAGQAARLHLMLDEVVAQRFFGTDLRPWWTQHFKNATLALAAAEEQTELRRSRAQDFNQKLMAQLQSRGGEKYAQLGSLVYRQVTGATSTAWNHKAGEEWPFMKEISSDGDVSTVDVIFPAFPFFLHVAPEFFRKLMLPLLVYSVNGTAPYGMDIKYNLSWAPHHLGTWPVCALRSDQQEQMPVEESGNMLIMIAAVSKKLGNLEWLSSYWPLLKTWADFLVASLPDPGNQLCTDDFEGPNPHNVNLAGKGIVALAAYAELLKLSGQATESVKYQKLAQGFVNDWLHGAADGDHFRRQYDLPGTWSQKYNLVWQKVLNLQGLFPDSVFEKEAIEYGTRRQNYGIPLDDRHNYTKADWSTWSAAFYKQEHFTAAIDDLWRFAASTPDRAPLTDWYDTITGHMKGFRARPVMGGIYIGLLAPLSDAKEVPIVV